MDPRIVDSAQMPPGQCLFSGDIEGPFIDLGLRAPWVNPYGYLSVRYVEDIASKLLEMVPQARVSELEDQLAALGAEIDQIRAEVEAERHLAKVRERV